ncbi:MAG TPA: hypothetical protein VFR80_16250 [Pyrinomonadaceae bacterium]|nr:hypothetical protein [Pyrinomonadaceae bacterium]
MSAIFSAGSYRSWQITGLESQMHREDHEAPATVGTEFNLSVRRERFTFSCRGVENKRASGSFFGNQDGSRRLGVGIGKPDEGSED